MPVYLPTAAVGNGHMLATLGASGEIMAVFYPHIDFAQNVHEALPFIYTGEPGRGKVIWLWDSSFIRSQRYVPGTNILTTTLRGAEPRIDIEVNDFIPASEIHPPSTAFIRTVTITNNSGQEFRGAFGHYFDLRLGEVAGKQAVRYDYGTGRFWQYFRDVAVVVGGDVPDQVRCGKAGYDNDRSAKHDLLDGHLNGQPEDIGDVDFAHLFQLQLAPAQSRMITVILMFDRTLHAAETAYGRLIEQGVPQLRAATEEFWAKRLARRHPVKVDTYLEEAYQRALMMLTILQDAETGSFVAAPEFDPRYDHCGGYGYCWPRDASESADALVAAGYSEPRERLVKWYLRSQLPDGRWGQRHWAEGPIASSWSLRDGFHQLDQSAAALLTICQWTLSEPSKRSARIIESFASIEAAANALAGMVDDRGFHTPACDLWETFEGIFAYTNAAFSVSLKAAAECAMAKVDEDAARRWAMAAERTRKATLSLFDGHHFARGLHNGGDIDGTVDTATLGLVAPFSIIDLRNPDERDMVVRNLATIEGTLGRHTALGPALIRYVGDGYLGGTVGCVNTLWAAQIKLKLALAIAADAPAEAHKHVEEALAYIHTALNHATVAGCLPELMAAREFPYWAAPHGWASGLLIKCVLLIDRWLSMTASQE